MTRLRKFAKPLIVPIVLLVSAQVGVSFLVRTQRVKNYLIAHLERTFGRPVEVSSFSAQILPTPRLDMNGISVGEDPAFGQEYFLRAEHLGASLRWIGLLQGHFQFGTLSLSRPSLILVRNAATRWNLEEWLPPARQRAGTATSGYGPHPPDLPSNYLQRIEIDEGRISFKLGDEKKPFAFTSVSGDVEQTAPGRWRLRLEAQPWRSGVALQSAGVVQVRGDLAGTSARLQPAQIRLHWDRVSLADLFRLITGNDDGVRGVFALDANASVGVGAAPGGDSNVGAGLWAFEIAVRSAQIHRWDLTERSDNPAVSLRAKGVWDLPAAVARADQLSVDLPHSNVRGSATFQTDSDGVWNLQIASAAIQASDLLAWYRAFHANVAADLDAQQFFSATGSLRGWPLRWEAAQVESPGGILRVPGLPDSLRIAALSGRLRENAFVLDPLRISLGGSADDARSAKSDRTATKPRGPERFSIAELRLLHDPTMQIGVLRLAGKLDDANTLFQITGAFGHPLNHGWELNGPVNAAVEWDWDHGLFQNGHWNGSVNFSKAWLHAAGLNEPILLEDARIEWGSAERSITLTKTQAFGASWSGTVSESPPTAAAEKSRWQFRLHADHLDATELDRWFGPRGRPNWFERLLPSLLGKSNADANPSELLRRISAEGDLTADSVTVEKLKLARTHARLSMNDLRLDARDVEAQWAGGTIHGSVSAVFAPLPEYEFSADLDRTNLAQFPWGTGGIDRWSGILSGNLRLSTKGVGREALLAGLAGRADLSIKNLEFHGWDVAASLEDSVPHTGTSHWTEARGIIEISGRSLSLTDLQLDGTRPQASLSGKIGFDQQLSLAFAPRLPNKIGAAKTEMSVLLVNGKPDAPEASMKTVSATPAF